MLRWDISPDFKARRAGNHRRTVRTAPVHVIASADRPNRAAVILSLPITICAILLFSVGGARGPQIVAAVKDRAFRTAAELRAHDPFLRRPGIDYTPTGAVREQRHAGGKVAPAANFTQIKAPAR